MAEQGVDSTGTTGVISQANTTETGYDTDNAVDFTVPAGGWTVSQIFVPGVYGDSTAAPVESMRVQFLEDGGGVPAGDLVIAEQHVAPAIDDGGTLTLDIEPVLLAEGTYWMSLQPRGPNLNFPLRWGWLLSDEGTGADAFLRNEGGAFRVGTDYIGFTELGVAPPDLGFTLLGALSTANASGSALPNVSSVSSVYPNPFRNDAVLTLDIAHAVSVRVTLHDLLGREVASLADRMMPAGQTHLRIDGRGRPSGVYFVRIETEGQTLTRKVSLVR